MVWMHRTVRCRQCKREWMWVRLLDERRSLGIRYKDILYIYIYSRRRIVISYTEILAPQQIYCMPRCKDSKYLIYKVRRKKFDSVTHSARLSCSVPLGTECHADLPSVAVFVAFSLHLSLSLRHFPFFILYWSRTQSKKKHLAPYVNVQPYWFNRYRAFHSIVLVHEIFFTYFSRAWSFLSATPDASNAN